MLIGRCICSLLLKNRVSCDKGCISVTSIKAKTLGMVHKVQPEGSPFVMQHDYVTMVRNYLSQTISILSAKNEI